MIARAVCDNSLAGYCIVERKYSIACSSELEGPPAIVPLGVSQLLTKSA